MSSDLVAYSEIPAVVDSDPTGRMWLRRREGRSSFFGELSSSWDTCEAIEGLHVETLSGSLSCRHRSSRGKIRQPAEALFGESNFVRK